MLWTLAYVDRCYAYFGVYDRCYAKMLQMKCYWGWCHGPLLMLTKWSRWNSTVAGVVATNCVDRCSVLSILADVVPRVANGMATVIQVFILSSGVLNITLSHTCDRWYLPIYLLRDGFLPLCTFSYGSSEVLVMGHMLIWCEGTTHISTNRTYH